MNMEREDKLFDKAVYEHFDRQCSEMNMRAFPAVPVKSRKRKTSMFLEAVPLLGFAALILLLPVIANNPLHIRLEKLCEKTELGRNIESGLSYVQDSFQENK